MYFNSQPHEEADTVQNSDITITDISTHSLTKRLTTFESIERYSRYISTHSLTKRLTVFYAGCIINSKHFNSQPHEEADGFHFWAKHY